MPFTAPAPHTHTHTHTHTHSFFSGGRFKQTIFDQRVDGTSSSHDFAPACGNDSDKRLPPLRCRRVARDLP